MSGGITDGKRNQAGRIKEERNREVLDSDCMVTLADLIEKKTEKELAEIIEGTRWNKPRIPTSPLDLLDELEITRFRVLPECDDLVTNWIKRKYWKRAVLRWAMNEKSGEVFIRMAGKDKYLEIYRTGRGSVSITAIERGTLKQG